MSRKSSFEAMRTRILESTLVHVPFDGWSEKSSSALIADSATSFLTPLCFATATTSAR